jgi:hypothetical protein
LVFRIVRTFWTSSLTVLTLEVGRGFLFLLLLLVRLFRFLLYPPFRGGCCCCRVLFLFLFCCPPFCLDFDLLLLDLPFWLLLVFCPLVLLVFFSLLFLFLFAFVFVFDGCDVVDADVGSFFSLSAAAGVLERDDRFCFCFIFARG